LYLHYDSLVCFLVCFFSSFTPLSCHLRLGHPWLPIGDSVSSLRRVLPPKVPPLAAIDPLLSTPTIILKLVFFSVVHCQLSRGSPRFLRFSPPSSWAFPDAKSLFESNFVPRFFWKSSVISLLLQEGDSRPCPPKTFRSLPFQRTPILSIFLSRFAQILLRPLCRCFHWRPLLLILAALVTPLLFLCSHEIKQYFSFPVCLRSIFILGPDSPIILFFSPVSPRITPDSEAPLGPNRVLTPPPAHWFSDSFFLSAVWTLMFGRSRLTIFNTITISPLPFPSFFSRLFIICQYRHSEPTFFRIRERTLDIQNGLPPLPLHFTFLRPRRNPRI